MPVKNQFGSADLERALKKLGKAYVPQTCNGYMREIFCFGFSKEEIAKAFK